jgi:hypothetical protein
MSGLSRVSAARSDPGCVRPVRLLDRALAAGGRDNVTLIVLRAAGDPENATPLHHVPAEPET